jgi:hypothetical protein
MTNLKKLHSDYDRLVRDLKREEAKSARLRTELDRAEAKERAAFTAAERAKPEHRAEAEAKQRAATAESDKVHTRYINHARGDVKRAHDKVIAAFLRIKDAEETSDVTVNVAHPGASVAIQAANVNGRRVRR